MVGWHHWLNGRESEQTPGDSIRQGSLACCSPWGPKESDRTEQLSNDNHTPTPFNKKGDWILTQVRWFFGTVVHNLLGLLAFQIKTTHLSIYWPVEQFKLGLGNSTTTKEVCFSSQMSRVLQYACALLQGPREQGECSGPQQAVLTCEVTGSHVFTCTQVHTHMVRPCPRFAPDSPEVMTGIWHCFQRLCLSPTGIWVL